MDARRPRVVIVGAGFAGLEAAKALRRAPVDVLVVDRRNHHLFQPLLYQVATAALSPADIAAPIRKILRRQRNARVLLGEASEVRPLERCLVVDGKRVEYDILVLAAGATHSYFAHPEWERLAPGLKTIEDATEIRRRFLLAFEAAEGEPDPSTRAALMTFVVVGGGPTGVELAGAMAEVARTVLPGDFRAADPRKARVVLVEGQERVLATMPPECSRRALEQLAELGVEVRTNANVTEIDANGVVAGGERIAASTVAWAAGVRASPLGRSLGVTLDRAGRVIVQPDLTIEGHREVFVIGDQAAVVDPRSKAPVPGVAPAAIQMGRFVGRTIARAVRANAARPVGDASNRSDEQPGTRGAFGAFHYVDKGTLATIGRSRAVADIRGRQVSGFLAWLLWAGVHILYLIQFRNRVFVILGWLWSYVFYDRGARLITGTAASGEHAR